MPQLKPQPQPEVPGDDRPAGNPATPCVRWPGALPPPGSPGFEQSAKAWLFEMSPARWWYEETFHRYPVELARMVRLRLEADIMAMQTALRTLAGGVPGRDPSCPEAAQASEFYTREREWARSMLEHVKMVEAALRAAVAARSGRRRSGAAAGRTARVPLPRPRPSAV